MTPTVKRRPVRMHAGLAQRVRRNLPTLQKTATYYVLHVTVAAPVGESLGRPRGADQASGPRRGWPPSAWRISTSTA